LAVGVNINLFVGYSPDASARLNIWSAVTLQTQSCTINHAPQHRTDLKVVQGRVVLLGPSSLPRRPRCSYLECPVVHQCLEHSARRSIAPVRLHQHGLDYRTTANDPDRYVGKLVCCLLDVPAVRVFWCCVPSYNTFAEAWFRTVGERIRRKFLLWRTSGQDLWHVCHCRVGLRTPYEKYNLLCATPTNALCCNCMV
jgi:hypothetical protein